MSVRFRLVSILEKSVKVQLPTECQKYSTRWGAPPINREPYTSQLFLEVAEPVDSGIQRDRIPNPRLGSERSRQWLPGFPYGEPHLSPCSAVSGALGDSSALS